MNEYGSDFQSITSSDFTSKSTTQFDSTQLYADGRHAIQALIAYKQWNRIWLPVYFCYDVVEAIESTGIKLMFYPDTPGIDDIAIIEELRFEKNDDMKKLVVKLVDRQTDEVVRQIPTEDLLDTLGKLSDLRGNIVNTAI